MSPQLKVNKKDNYGVKINSEGLKIVKFAVKDLLKTKKAVYLNIINSFLHAEKLCFSSMDTDLYNSNVFEEVHTIFSILENKVSLRLIIYTTESNLDRVSKKYLKMYKLSLLSDCN